MAPLALASFVACNIVSGANDYTTDPLRARVRPAPVRRRRRAARTPPTYCSSRRRVDVRRRRVDQPRVGPLDHAQLRGRRRQSHGLHRKWRRGDRHQDAARVEEDVATQTFNSIAEAEQHCKSAGADWQLPTRIRARVAHRLDAGHTAIDVTAFGAIPSTPKFWTASPSRNGFWTVDFATGEVNVGGGQRVRCVQPQTVEGQQYEILIGHQTIVDRSRSCAGNASRARHEDPRRRADVLRALTLSGTGWRVPSVKELLTIVSEVIYQQFEQQQSSRTKAIDTRRSTTSLVDSPYWSTSPRSAVEAATCPPSIFGGGTP